MDTSPAWWDGPLVGFDLESTGVNLDTDRIVTANITFHSLVHGTRVRDFLLNPGIEIPAEASAVHGISTEHAVEHGVDARDGIGQILEALQTCAHLPFVAFNGVYDFSLLDREARRHGYEPFVPTYVVDPFVMDKHVDQYRRGSRKLIDVSAHYGVVLDNAHSADADALAAVLLARQLGRLGRFTTNLAELHAQQTSWKTDQDRSFREYRASKGLPEPDGALGFWPIIPFNEEQAAA